MTITKKELIERGSQTQTVKDSGPRGVKTVSTEDVSVGDFVVINNEFVEVVEDRRERAAVVADILSYLEDNTDVLSACVEQLDSYNGYLGDDRYYQMDEINELFSGTDPIDLLYKAFYGHDEECYTVNADGDREYSEFNPNRNYFRFNGYGNFVSCDYPDYSDKLDDDLVYELQSYRNEVDAIDDDDDLARLFDELDAIDKAEEDEDANA